MKTFTEFGGKEFGELEEESFLLIMYVEMRYLANECIAIG